VASFAERLEIAEEEFFIWMQVTGQNMVNVGCWNADWHLVPFAFLAPWSFGKLEGSQF
jgi:hypothetical protein